MTSWDSQRDSTITRPGAEVASSGRPVARLMVVHPPALIRELVLPASAVLGRSPEPADLPHLRHPTVSRRHASIEWEPRKREHVLLDLGSHNGTRLNGAALPPGSPAPLGDGDVVRLGDVLGVFEATDGLAAADPAEVSREAIPGLSAAARRVRAAVARAAPDPAPVLVAGPTGAGKERVAAELHRLGPARGPLVIVNCAAVSPHLFESQLFGHERGAFTGATAAQEGVFRAADGGSLFLDEVGEIPLELQAKLLRAVQQGEVMPVGSSRTHRVDVRIIAATNRELEPAVERGELRRDLLARLSVWQVAVAPLTERRADLLEWISRLHGAWAEQRGRRGPSTLDLAVDAAETLLLADWPDNLRGLDRLIHGLDGRPGDAGAITASELPAWIRAAPGSAGLPGPAAAPQPPAPTRDELVAVLEQNGWSVRAAARHFQRDRRQIYRWIESHGIDRRGHEG